MPPFTLSTLPRAARRPFHVHSPAVPRSGAFDKGQILRGRVAQRALGSTRWGAAGETALGLRSCCR